MSTTKRQTTESSPLSLREIQELEQRRAQEEANKRRKNAPAGGAEPITKLLWETRVGGNEPVPLSEIMAQEEAATQSDEPKPKKEAAQPQAAQSEDVWSSGSGQHTVSAAQSKASLRDIQQEEQKSGKQQPQQQQQQKKGGKGQQASASGQQEVRLPPPRVARTAFRLTLPSRPGLHAAEVFQEAAAAAKPVASEGQPQEGKFAALPLPYRLRFADVVGYSG